MANRGAGTYEVDPISRIEGHLGVKVTTNASGIITGADAHGNLWRGFENFLLGRDINDAITFVQRICGVCPVPHGMTSTYAVDTVLGYSEGHITFKTYTSGGKTYGVPPKALLIRNLVLSAEFLMSSITHFYHLAAPSYVQGPNMAPWTPYFADSYYHAALLKGASQDTVSATAGVVPVADATAHLWDAVIISYVRALKIRRMTFEAGALFAGRMPMTSCFIGGGVTTDGTANLTGRCDKFIEIIREVGLFIINEYVPIALVLGLLYPNFDNAANAATSPYLDAGLPTDIGAGLGRFLAWGGFPNLDDTLTLPGGVKDLNSNVTTFQVLNKAQVKSKFLTGGTNSVPTNLTEDITNSRYDNTAGGYGGANVKYPGAVNRTKPKRSNGYTYMKAPRWAGYPCEVGPLARLAVAGIYPVEGTTLTAIPGYKEIYTVNGDGTGGLDTRVLASTIVYGLTNGAGAGSLVAAAQTWILGLVGGISTMDRLRARAIESLVLVQKMVGTVSKNVTTGALTYANDGWAHELKTYTGAGAFANDTSGSTWSNKSIPTGTVQGWGGTEAPRGALMHQTTIQNGKITAYQCIVPTTWNGSPKCANSRPGAIEAAVINAPFGAATQTFTKADGTASAATQSGIEVLRIAQSFDPCIACAVH